MANYIFVDFDGPLIPGKLHLLKEVREVAKKFAAGEDVTPIFDPLAIRMLNLWAYYGNAKVVFSTSWARTFRGTYAERELFLIKALQVNGYTGEFADDPVTPKRFSSEHIHEIQEWCYDNLKEGDKYIAIDDADLSFLEHDRCLHKGGKWIRVDYNDGLTWKNFKEGCEWLNVDNDKLLYEEFGIVPLTEEEKKERERALELFRYLV